MSKIFNITGNCHASKHYMADISKKLERTFTMVERGDYFIINRPRQYGKTTMLYTVADYFAKKEDYLVFNISFEGIGDAVFNTEQAFAPAFIRLLNRKEKTLSKEIIKWLQAQEKTAVGLETLSDLITELVELANKRIVVLIDEVDKSSNNQLFISFLAMLRNKYLERNDISTFHAVILAGVHDVKSLKLKLRPDEEQKLNSPWNIAAEYKVDMNLQVAEIKPMLTDYCQERGVAMNIDEIAERLFYYTSGYPFLVSKLCKMIDEDFLPEKEKQEWTADDVEVAVKKLVQESNTNFDTLVKNLENNPDLYDFIYKIAIDGQIFPFNIHNKWINMGITHGIFKSKNGAGVRIHNRIYEEVIYNYMSMDMLISKYPQVAETTNIYKNSDKTLNMEAVILGFQAFMKKEYSKKDRNFLEKNGRLVFLAFLKPILNGHGHDFKEIQISEEKRLDLVITYLHQKFVAELKLWYGPKAHEEGLTQLTDYLDRQNLDTGYLLIFDHSEIKKWNSEWIETDGKKIFIAWV